MQLSKNNLQEKRDRVYDVIVIGGGAGGLLAMGSRYHHTYLSHFNLEKERNYLVTDKTGRTSHPRIFAIGDLKVGLNQVAIAVGDGALASTQIWRDLRRAEGARPNLDNLPVSV